MATGYTYKLYDAKPQTFGEFAMSCARAFGALIDLRDEPNDAPIPERFEPSDYHVKAREKAERELARLGSMTADEIAAYNDEQIRATEERNAIDAAKREDMRGRYEDMLAQVYAWSPPSTDHVELKRFMIEQLESSIKLDCAPYLSQPVLYSQALSNVRGDVAYHIKRHAEEVERTEELNRWLRQLRESLTEAAP